MFLIRQALLSIKGQWIKSLILISIISISGIVLFSSYFIKETSKHDIKSLKEKIAINGTIKHQYLKEELFHDHSKMVQFSNFLDDLGKMEGINQVDYLKFSHMNDGVLANLYDTNNNPYGIDNSALLGLSSPKAILFNQEIAALNSGRYFTESEISAGQGVAMIYVDDSKDSHNFYTSTGEPVKEGDTITLKLPISWNDQGVATNFYEEELLIVGTFKKSKDIDYMWCKFYNSGNNCLDYKVLIPGKLFDSIEAKTKDSGDLIRISIDEVDVKVDMSTDLDEITVKINEEIKKSGGKYTYKAQDDKFNQLLPVLKGMEKNSLLVFRVGLFLSICALMSIMYIFIKERQRELWVFRALGKYQIEVVLQILIEVALLTLLALVVSTFAGLVITRLLVSDLLSFGNYTELIRYYCSYVIILLGMTLLSTLVPSLYFTRTTAKRRM